MSNKCGEITYKIPVTYSDSFSEISDTVSMRRKSKGTVSLMESQDSETDESEIESESR